MYHDPKPRQWHEAMEAATGKAFPVERPKPVRAKVLDAELGRAIKAQLARRK